MGIGSINQRRSQDKANRGNAANELWLRDGDIAYVSIVPSGDDGDERLDDFYVHVLQITGDDGQRRFSTNYCMKRSQDDELPCESCANEVRAQHQFGFWAYVHQVLHNEKRNDSDWESVDIEGVGVRYKEEVDGFRVFAKGFGFNDSLWNQVVDLYQDEGRLNKSVVRIKRTGSGMRDTVFAFKAMPQTASIPEEKSSEVSELVGIKSYFSGRYNSVASSSEKESKPWNEDFTGENGASPAPQKEEKPIEGFDPSGLF